MSNLVYPSHHQHFPSKNSYGIRLDENYYRSKFLTESYKMILGKPFFGNFFTCRDTSDMSLKLNNTS